MFSGIVEEAGTIRAVEPMQNGRRLRIEAPGVCEGLEEGDSIAVDGVCLTVVDLADDRHRTYLEKIYALHRRPGRSSFDFFYQAQCVWEDAMAEAVAAHLADRRMVVIAGNGHIVGKFGIPNRAFRRTGVPFATVMPAPAGETVRLDDADYIWVTGTLK